MSMPFDRAVARIDQSDAFQFSVMLGLSRPQKTIPSCWLYDQRGSALFEQITRLDEYYPTTVETEILRNYAGDIAGFCGEGALVFEYGAGAGVKTEILLSALVRPVRYVPIDIAIDELARTATRIAKRFPALETFPIVADFTRDFALPRDLPPGARMAFFPGSTIGNLDRSETLGFLRRVRLHVGRRGTAIIGVDLKKDLDVLLAAYDDRDGVTAAFNRNLLTRINRELDADFRLERFVHEARWNAVAAAVEMHLVSLESCIVSICGRKFAFRAGESIHTESSRKYDVDDFARLAEISGWRVAKIWQDGESRFAVFGLKESIRDFVTHSGRTGPEKSERGKDG
jgi:dimethylhistidine N-methyltransferase